MEANTILTAIVIIGVVSYLLDQFVDYINLRSQRSDIPPLIEAFYEKEKYVKSLAYHRDQTKFAFISSGANFVIAMILLITGAYGWLDGLLRPFFQNDILLALAFFGILVVFQDIFSLGFDWYSTFVIEERYGFNKTTPRTFVSDKIKGFVLSAILGGALIAILIFLIQVIGENFWIWFAILAAAVILFVNMFYTTLILPIFNKLTILPDGELKTEIEKFSQKVQFPLDNIFVIDGSKRSNKANAFFSGIGKKKKIVLYDTLINNHTTDELVAVLAHEVGHFKKKHIIQGYFLSVLQIVVTLFIMSRMIYSENVSLALGGSVTAIHLNLLAFGMLYAPISFVTGLFLKIHSRKNEFEADAYASETFNPESLSSALKKLSVDSLSNLYPHPLYVFLNYSHPPLLKRLEALSAK